MEDRIQKISLIINNKTYSLKIPAEQEEIVRGVAKDLNSKIILYQKYFNSSQLNEECIVMAAIDLVKNSRLQNKEVDDTEFNAGLNQLDQKVQDYLDKVGSLN